MAIKWWLLCCCYLCVLDTQLVLLSGSLPAVKLIIEIAGSDRLEQRDANNRTPLMLATMGGHGEVVNLLLSHRGQLVTAPHSGVRHSGGLPFRGSAIPRVRHSGGPPFLSLTLQEARVRSYSAHCATLVYLRVSLKCDVTLPVLYSDRHSLTVYDSDNFHKL